jgi:hypothetical protein
MVNVPPSVSKQANKVDKPKQGLAETEQPVYVDLCVDLSNRSCRRPIDYRESSVA